MTEKPAKPSNHAETGTVRRLHLLKNIRQEESNFTKYLP